MSPGEALLVMLAGLVGGALNTMAAGGGVIMFLTLLLTGMPAQVAIATSQVAIPGSFLPAVRPAWRHRREYRPLLPAIGGAAVGTALGVWVVSQLTPATFRMIAPVLLLVAAGLLIIQPHMPNFLSRRTDNDASGPRSRGIALGVTLGLVGVYGGAFGGGVAVAVLATFAVLTPWSWGQANATKNMTCLVMSMVCSGAFALTGLANLGAVALLAGAQLVGGAIGQHVANRISEDKLRKSVAVTTVLGAVSMVNT